MTTPHTPARGHKVCHSHSACTASNILLSTQKADPSTPPPTGAKRSVSQGVLAKYHPILTLLNSFWPWCLNNSVGLQELLAIQKPLLGAQLGLSLPAKKIQIHIKSTICWFSHPELGQDTMYSSQEVMLAHPLLLLLQPIQTTGPSNKLLPHD